MQQLLNDPQQPPTVAYLQTLLGENNANFNHLMEVFGKYGIQSEWNYYKDGKNWLCKVQYKKKTVLWLSVWEDCFKLSFFFTEKTRAGIELLEIDSGIKSYFAAQKATGKLIPLILEIRNDSMLDDVEKMIRYKMSCK